MAAPRVFLSYARSDGEAFASELRRRLQAGYPDLTLWQDRADLEGGVGWWKQIAQALETVETLVMVMTPAVTQSEVAQKEWRYARQQGVRVCPVLGLDPDAFDFGRLPNWMRKAHCYDLAKEWESFIAFLRSPHQEARVPFMAPDLRHGFIARPTESEALVAMLLDRHRLNPLAITTALQGAGGFGKTTLAAAVCHDDDVVAAFDDGILWATLGERPNVQQELTRLYAALTGERPTFVDAEDASIELAARLEDKNCLIVVDDVWDPNHVKPFLRGGHSCARLITTRRLQVVTDVNASRVLVDEMTADESVAMLTGRLSMPAADLSPFHRLARRLGEWPILLRLAAAQLRERVERGDTAEGALAFVNRALDKRGVVAFDRASAASRNEAVATTIGASLALLEDADRKRATELAIYVEPKSVPLSAASALWGLDGFDTEELVQRLDDVSLVEFDLKTGTLRMHDVLRAHLHAQVPDPAAVHRRLTHDGWRDPQALPDAFAWRWFGWHVVQAGESSRLRDLLLDYRWLAAKLRATDPQALASDLELVSDLEPFALIRDALRLGAYHLGRDGSQLGAQLRGRLDRGRWPEVDRLLDSLAEFETGPRLRLDHPSLTHPGGALAGILKGHSGPIEALALAPDGSRAVTGSADGTVRVWDLATWQIVRVLVGHAGPVHSVAVVPGVDRLVSASEDRTVRVWDLEAGSCIAVLHGHHQAVRGVAVSPDGRSAASLGEDGSVRVWDLGTLRSARAFKGAFHQLRGIAYTPDGGRIVFGAGDGTLCALDAASHREVRRIEGQQAIFSALAIDAAGRSVLAGADDGSLGIWDLDSGSQIATFGGHAKSVGGVAFGPEKGAVVSGGADRVVRVWDIDTARLTHAFDGHSGSVRSVAVPSTRPCVFSASGDRTVRCWHVAPSHHRADVSVETGAVVFLAIAADGRRMVSASQSTRTPFASSSAQVWDAATDRLEWVLDGHTKPIQALRLTADGRRALTASRDRTLRVWDLDTGRTLHVLKGHWDGVAAVAMTPAGDRAVSLSVDRTVRLWDLEQGRTLRVLVGSDAPASDWLRAHALAMNDETAPRIDVIESAIPRGARVAVSADGRRAVIAEGHTLATWHLDTGRVVTTSLEDFQVEEVGIDADAAIVGSILGAVCLVHPENGCVLRSLDPPRVQSRTGRILDLVLDAAACRATAATRDGTICTWDITTGQELASFDSGVADADTVAIAPGGRLAYAVSGDTVAALDLRGQRLIRRLSLDHNITAIAVTPDGLTVALGDESGRAHVVRLVGV